MMESWMSDPLHDLLQERGVLLADGATGTNLFALGLQTGEPPELWNIDQPEQVKAHYRSFVDAGSDVFLTNSFGGTSYRLKLHGDEDRVGEINEAAARLAREVADAADRKVLVGGSMGPTGELFEPLGALTHDKAVAAFREQAEALARGGVDVLWIETLSAREEVDAAIEAAGSTGLPVVCTVSFDTNGRTMMGITPHAFADHCAHGDHAPTAFGSNCGVGASELLIAIVNMRDAADPQSMLIAKGNCGIPEWHGDRIVYNGTPELMAEYAVLARDAGVSIVGGCCGTTPAHIRAMRTALDTRERGPVPDIETITARLGEVSAGARAQYGGDLDPGAGATGKRASGGRGQRRRRDRTES
jgi:5-methyltetrahydrofolate--homocysteine methyltransferase